MVVKAEYAPGSKDFSNMILQAKSTGQSLSSACPIHRTG